MELAHPLGHLLFGERLYYLLINVHTDLFGVRELLCNRLKKAKLYGSSCAYMVFGESDILVRVWGQERRFREFLKSLNESLVQYPSGQIQIKTYLITAMNTWYEKVIEAEPKWPANQLDTVLERCLNSREIDPVFLHKDDASQAESTKIFVFIEQPAVRAKDVFREMCDRARNCGLPDLDRVSLYQYRSAEKRGVLMKAESANFRKASVSLVNLARDLKQSEYAANTTTYVCAEPLKVEESFPSPSSVEPVDCQKYAYNLLISHDCNEGRFTDSNGQFTDEVAHKHSDQFKELIGSVGRYRRVFGLMARRPEFIEKLRSIYRWTVRREEQNLRRYLIDFYIELEVLTRDLLSNNPVALGKKDPSRKYVSIAKRVLPDDHFHKFLEAVKQESLEDQSKQYTLGNLVDLIAWAKGQLPNAKEHTELDKFREVLSPESPAQQGLIQNRNDLMHGNSLRLFRTESGGDSDLWIGFVSNYLEAELLRPRLVEALEKALPKKL